MCIRDRSCLEGPRALEALKAAVSDAESDIQRAAPVGLGVAGQTESLPVILAATQVADPATRLVALSALISFESPDVLRALVGAATDADESVRSAAIGFLSTTAGPGAVSYTHLRAH